MPVDIYAYPNAGVLYDAGYFIGVSTFFGGSGAGARATKSKKQSGASKTDNKQINN